MRRNEILHQVRLEHFSSDEAAIDFCLLLFNQRNNPYTRVELWDEGELIYRHPPLPWHQV